MNTGDPVKVLDGKRERTEHNTGVVQEVVPSGESKKLLVKLGNGKTKYFYNFELSLLPQVA